MENVLDEIRIMKLVYEFSSTHDLQETHDYYNRLKSLNSSDIALIEVSQKIIEQNKNMMQSVFDLMR